MKATLATSLALLAAAAAAACAAVVTPAQAVGVDRGVDRGVLISRDDTEYTGRGFFALNPLRPTIKYIPGRRSMVRPITVYPIFYGNWTDADKNIISDFISGIDSSSFWKITAKYYNYNLTDKGEPGPKTYVTSTVKLGKAVSDPDRSLGTWLNGPNAQTWDEVMTLVNNYVKSGDLPSDTDGFYLVLTDEETNEGDSCRSYCGWHTSFFSTQDGARQNNVTFGIDYSAPNLIYSWVGNAKSCGANGITHCGTRNFFASPNDSPFIDQMLSPIAHELAEASSNPDTTEQTTAWNDVEDGVNGGFENGDNCAYVFGSQTSHDHSAGFYYNQEWNGRKYYIQQMWDPETQLCGPTFPSKVPSDCAKLQALLPDRFISDDCCNSGFADCSSGSIIGLNLNNLKLTGSMHDFVLSINSKFGRLEELSLNGNNFTGPLPDAICHQSQLIVLRASSMPNLAGPIPSCLGRLSNLRRIDMQNNPHLTGPIPSSLTSLTNLKLLHLGSNALNGTLPDFSALPDLTLFRVDGNRDLSGVLRSGFAAFPGGSSVSQAGNDGVPLRTCDVSGTKVCVEKGHVGPSCFADLTC